VLTPAVAAAAAAALAQDVAPIDDIRSTADYRAAVARNVLLQFLDELAAHGARKGTP